VHSFHCLLYKTLTENTTFESRKQPLQQLKSKIKMQSVALK